MSASSKVLGRIEAGKLGGMHEGVSLEITDEEGELIARVELSYLGFGKLVSGGSVPVTVSVPAGSGR